MPARSVILSEAKNLVVDDLPTRPVIPNACEESVRDKTIRYVILRRPQADVRIWLWTIIPAVEYRDFHVACGSSE